MAGSDCQSYFKTLKFFFLLFYLGYCNITACTPIANQICACTWNSLATPTARLQELSFFRKESESCIFLLYLDKTKDSLEI